MPLFYVAMLCLYAVTLFISATLLFLVQPMVGKMILPYLGGTPAVWNTCMVFFQAMLLLGYTYAHLTTTWLGARLQALVHVLVLAVPAIALPIVVNKDLAPQGEANPVFGVFWLLLLAVGLPFFVVAASAPLLQKWFAATDHPAAKDPYFLYGASNLGSMLALFGYPLLLEPISSLPDQSWLWMIGYCGLVLLIVTCVAFLWLSRKPVAPKPDLRISDEFRTANSGLTVGRRLRWIVLAFVPSSLMLAVTTFLTTDIAAVPFLWVLPLGIYLLSFILVFSRIPALLHWIMVGLLPLVVLALIFTMLSGIRPVMWLEINLHLVALFVVCMVCHGELARDRPSTEHLTGYYLLMSLGGVLGGLFNTLVAPLIFVSVAEYDVGLVLACLLIPRIGGEQRGTGMLVYNLILAWLIGTAGAYLFTMALRFMQTDPGTMVAPVATLGTLVCLGGIIVLIAGYVLMGRLDLLNRVFDVVLPMLVALLMLGLWWGVDVLEGRSTTLAEWMAGESGFMKRLQLPAWQIHMYLLFGVPALCCIGFIFRPVQFGLGVAALLMIGHLYKAQDERGIHAIHRERSFYGVLLAQATVNDEYHSLIHGNINHGVQRMHDWNKLGRELFAPLAAATPQGAAVSAVIRNQMWAQAHYPVAYFHPDTPYGQMFLSFNGNYAKKNIAIIGLGTGGLSGYAYPGQKWTYFELDPAVEKIARDRTLFTYLSDCKDRGVDLKVILGDARLQLEKIKFDKPEDKFDVIAFDAFTSDAIPIHLVTDDALKLYLSKLTDNGIVVFHISNRYVDLEPVIARLQEENNLAGLIQKDDKGDGKDHYNTEVAILARRAEAFGPLAQDPRWEQLTPRSDVRLWTDKYSNLLGVFKWAAQ